MSREFATWREARDHAEAAVLATGIAHGIEKPTGLPKGLGQAWTVKMLPRRETRFGWELRCEAIEPASAYEVKS